MKYFPLLFLSLLFSGCEVYEPDGYREMVIVEAFAVADRPLPQIRVFRTIPADSVYKSGDVALKNAIVTVSLLDEHGDAEEVIPYQATSSSSGRYRPSEDHILQPGRRYRLDVHFNNRPEKIKAYTTVPEAFSIQNEVPDTVVYQSKEQLELIVSATGKQNQKVYVFNAIAQNTDPQNLTPYYKKQLEDEKIRLDELLNNASDLINEENFKHNEDGTITLRFPWMSLAFYGDNIVVTNSIDRNLAEFVRSRNVQLGGSTLPPGEIPNIRYNVEGGIGIFGSLSSDTVATYFKRPE